MDSKARADLVEHTVSSEPVFQGALLDVRRDVVRLPDGARATREWVKHPGAVAIIPLLDDGRIVLERQFRYPLHTELIELPAGKVDPGEAPLLTGQRELLEETGYRAAVWRHALSFHPLCAYSDEVIEIFLATDLTLAQRSLDAGEFLEVLTVPLEEAFSWLAAGKITDAKTMIGLYWLDRHLASKR